VKRATGSTLALCAVVAGALAVSACTAPPPPRYIIPSTAPTAEVTIGTCVSIEGKADRRCTPGALNPEVTQATIGTTICVPHWSERMRPPARRTNQLEALQITAYGLPGGPGDYENDHLEPISLGGALLDARNLYPQAHADATRKDRDESRLHRAVCDGQVTLVQAQAEMLALWSH
jgi:hypothetical protein